MAYRDPEPSTLACLPTQRTWPGFLVYTSEAIITIIVLGVAIGINSMRPHTLPIIERDPALSYALTEPETVPAAVLLAVGLIVPLGVISLAHCIRACRTPRVSWRVLGKSLGWACLAMLQTIALVLFVTNLIKMLVGRPRPNFFAMCNYAGYADAIKSGNWTAYHAATMPGAFGDVSKCQASVGMTYEAQRSFVSGHASISFATMMFTTYLLRMYLGVGRSSHFGLPAAIAAVPLLGAGYIAISRVQDRFHNTDDIGLGAIVGVVCAYLVWEHFLVHKRAGHTAITAPLAIADAVEDGDDEMRKLQRRSSGTTPFVSASPDGASQSWKESSTTPTAVAVSVP